MKRILLAEGLSRWMLAVQGGWLCLLLVNLSACSYLSQRSTPSSSEEKVSKAEYDALLAKYRQALSSKTEGPAASTAPVTARGDDVGTAPTPELVETVDVFQNGVMVTPSDNKRNAPMEANSNVNLKASARPVPGARNAAPLVGKKAKGRPTRDAELERQIKAWRQAAQLVEQKKYDQALTILRPLEKSTVKQIGVRTRFLTAEILYAQQEYDLAFQVYEEVIQQYAFSGLVLASLDRLVSCADKLNLTEKKEQYYSLLHDFFGAGPS